jgi:threonylcarbamoyladenosine tRNA methylthiotransferase MtaB
MKRRHSRAQAIEFCARVRAARPDVVFGADLIAGFPTETDEMFDNTMALVDDCGLTYLHVFPYSERGATPAAKMPPVAKKLRKERARRLREKGAAALTAYLAAQVGRTTDVLMETATRGRTPGFAAVNVEAAALEAGDIAHVVLTGSGADHLTGRISA